MSIYSELKKLLDNEIKEDTTRLYNVIKQIEKNNEIRKIVSIVNDNQDVYLSQVRRISFYYPELESYVLLLQEIETMMISLKNEYFKEIIPDRIRVVLSMADMSSEEIIQVINDFVLCDKLNNYVKSDDSDSRVKKIVEDAYRNVNDNLDNAYQLVFGVLISEIRKRFNSLGKQDLLLEEKINLEVNINKLQNINMCFDNDGIINQIDDLEFFYSWLKGRLGFEKEKEIINNIINYQIKSKEKDIFEKINENRERIIKQITDIIISKKDNPFEKINLDSFNEEELKVILKVKSIYLKMNNLYKDRYEFSDLELGDRKNSYYNQNKLEWEIVLSDIENNLLPNINVNKEYVLEKFKYICEVYEKYETDKRHLDYRDKKINIINLIIHDLKEMLNIDDLNNTTYDYLFDENVPSLDLRYDGNYDYFAIRYFLRRKVKSFLSDLEKEVERLQQEINNVTLNNDKGNVLYIEDIKKKFESLMQEYSIKYQNYEKYLKEKNSNNNLKSNNSENNNLVFCLHDLSFNNEHNIFDEKLKNEFIEAVKTLHSNPRHELKKPVFSEVMFKSSVSNKNMQKFNNPYFTPYRIRGTGNYRTGVIEFRICSANKEKLKKYYSLENSYAVFVPFKVIIVDGKDHSEYHEFVKYIRNNKSYLESIGKKFLDPNTNFDELCKMIDDGIEIKNNLLEGGKIK